MATIFHSCGTRSSAGHVRDPTEATSSARLLRQGACATAHLPHTARTLRPASTSFSAVLRHSRPTRGLRISPRAVVVAVSSADDIPQVAVEGDVVSIHYVCKDESGEVLESSTESHPEGLSFEIGAGDVTGNPFFQGFDAAVRGLSVGQVVQLEASGGEWQKDLVFTVPRDHEEMQRLDGRYKNQGGVKEGAILELANGAKALILKVSPEAVTLDANNMLAGKKLLIDIELLEISKFSA
mmetsp:Transcript_11275/g.31968  ORF Transcript_11275/g.31968 Transcript_11275/m.31968 type:complete len:239 (+) Transcript_11275:188-904(+)